jgi:hypothetical protein
MAQPGFIEGPWQRLEGTDSPTLLAGAPFTSSFFFPLRIQQEDVLRFGGGGILIGAQDTSAKVTLVGQFVGVLMRSGLYFAVPLYPPTQLTLPPQPYAGGAYLVVTMPWIEIPGEALGSGGWPTIQFEVHVSLKNTDTSNSHGVIVTFSLPYQIISRQRAV